MSLSCIVLQYSEIPVDVWRHWNVTQFVCNIKLASMGTCADLFAWSCLAILVGLVDLWRMDGQTDRQMERDGQTHDHNTYHTSTASHGKNVWRCSMQWFIPWNNVSYFCYTTHRCIRISYYVQLIKLSIKTIQKYPESQSHNMWSY